MKAVVFGATGATGTTTSLLHIYALDTCCVGLLACLLRERHCSRHIRKQHLQGDIVCTYVNVPDLHDILPFLVRVSFSGNSLLNQLSTNANWTRVVVVGRREAPNDVPAEDIKAEVQQVRFPHNIEYYLPF